MQDSGYGAVQDPWGESLSIPSCCPPLLLGAPTHLHQADALGQPIRGFLSVATPFLELPLEAKPCWRKAKEYCL